MRNELAQRLGRDLGRPLPRPAETEYEQFRDAGVDGMFTDFPDVAARVVHHRQPAPGIVP
ncbi:MAG TPA: hypothetical protein VGI12_22560 [Vicinamibacterales bacterium]|jgi:glycerophosphoryl diester phosphodiesterase